MKPCYSILKKNVPIENGTIKKVTIMHPKDGSIEILIGGLNGGVCKDWENLLSTLELKMGDKFIIPYSFFGIGWNRTQPWEITEILEIPKIEYVQKEFIVESYHPTVECADMHDTYYCIVDTHTSYGRYQALVNSCKEKGFEILFDGVQMEMESNKSTRSYNHNFLIAAKGKAAIENMSSFMGDSGIKMLTMLGNIKPVTASLETAIGNYFGCKIQNKKATKEDGSELQNKGFIIGKGGKTIRKINELLGYTLKV